MDVKIETTVSGMRAGVVHTQNIVQLIKETTNIYETKDLISKIALLIVKEAYSEGYHSAIKMMQIKMLETSYEIDDIYTVIEEAKKATEE